MRIGSRNAIRAVAVAIFSVSENVVAGYITPGTASSVILPYAVFDRLSSSVRPLRVHSPRAETPRRCAAEDSAARGAPLRAKHARKRREQHQRGEEQQEPDATRNCARQHFADDAPPPGRKREQCPCYIHDSERETHRRKNAATYRPRERRHLHGDCPGARTLPRSEIAPARNGTHTSNRRYAITTRAIFTGA